MHVIFRNITGRRRAEEALKSETAKLERLSSLMVNRNQRILELKQEVNRLLAQLGRPAKYEEE